MSDSKTGQVSTNAAQVYEEFFVPALFQEWAGRVAGAAQIEPGQRVLDVACGTGALTRVVAERVGPNGSVVGLDLNEGMLAVAKQKAPDIEWKHAHAEALPFDDNSFDAVVSQFGFMFFQDQSAAVQEMARVLRAKGTLAVAVWDSLQNTPGYAAMAGLLERLFGDQVAQALQAPFTLGDTQALDALFRGADLDKVKVTTYDGLARFPSIRSWVFVDVKGWTLSDMIDEGQYQQLLQEAEKELAPFVTPQGTVEFHMPAHIVTATKK
jgi:ubiquinone/menaquinone biosynthesis C-methylase UbiE